MYVRRGVRAPPVGPFPDPVHLVLAGVGGSDSARHLAWLRDQLGDRFVAGVVLHTGNRVYRLGERITAAPICTLWA